MYRDPVDRVISQYYMQAERHWGNIPTLEVRINEQMEYLASRNCTFNGDDALLQKSANECVGCLRD